MPTTNHDIIGRTLAVLAQSDYGLDVSIKRHSITVRLGGRTILDRATHAHTQLALPGPVLLPSSIVVLEERIRRRMRVGTWLVLAGSGALDLGMVGQTISAGQMNSR